MEDTTKAWLAGLIDGEGSVMLNKRTFSEKARETVNPAMLAKPRYRPVVVVASNTDYRLFEAIAARVPGQIYKHQVSNTRDSHNPRRREQWTYRWNVGQIAEFLPLVKPWLVLKDAQAELLLEAMSIKLRLTPGKGNEWRHAEQRDPLFEQLDAIYGMIRELNTRGRR